MKVLSTMAGVVIALFALPTFAITCSVSSTGVALGSYTPNQGSPADSAGRIDITCEKSAIDTLPTTVNYALSISRGGSANYSPREMTSGAHKLSYNLYRDSSRLAVWGDTTGGTTNVTGALQLQAPLGTASTTHSVYGRIFGSQNAVPGAYADALVVTVSY